MSIKVDLHGLTEEEALAEVDRELNHAFIQETEDRHLAFVTGRGSVLHNAVQEYLQNHPLVKYIKVGASNTSVTLEEL